MKKVLWLMASVTIGTGSISACTPVSENAVEADPVRIELGEEPSEKAIDLQAWKQEVEQITNPVRLGMSLKDLRNAESTLQFNSSRTVLISDSSVNVSPFKKSETRPPFTAAFVQENSDTCTTRLATMEAMIEVESSLRIDSLSVYVGDLDQSYYTECAVGTISLERLTSSSNSIGLNFLVSADLLGSLWMCENGLFFYFPHLAQPQGQPMSGLMLDSTVKASPLTSVMPTFRGQTRISYEDNIHVSSNSPLYIGVADFNTFKQRTEDQFYHGQSDVELWPYLRGIYEQLEEKASERDQEDDGSTN